MLSDGDSNDLFAAETMYALYRATLDPPHIRCHEAAYDPSIVTSHVLKARDHVIVSSNIDGPQQFTKTRNATDIAVYLANKSERAL